MKRSVVPFQLYATDALSDALAVHAKRWKRRKASVVRAAILMFLLEDPIIQEKYLKMAHVEAGKEIGNWPNRWSQQKLGLARRWANRLPRKLRKLVLTWRETLQCAQEDLKCRKMLRLQIRKLKYLQVVGHDTNRAFYSLLEAEARYRAEHILRKSQKQENT